MSLSNITDVDHSELNEWNASRESIFQEHLDDFTRRKVALDQSRSHDRSRIDDGQAKLLVFGQSVNIFPSFELSHRLGFLVGGNLGPVGITPVGLVEDFGPLIMRHLDDRCDA